MPQYSDELFMLWLPCFKRLTCFSSLIIDEVLESQDSIATSEYQDSEHENEWAIIHARNLEEIKAKLDKEYENQMLSLRLLCATFTDSTPSWSS